MTHLRASLTTAAIMSVRISPAKSIIFVTIFASGYFQVRADNKDVNIDTLAFGFKLYIL